MHSRDCFSLMIPVCLLFVGNQHNIFQSDPSVGYFATRAGHWHRNAIKCVGRCRIPGTKSRNIIRMFHSSLSTHHMQVNSKCYVDAEHSYCCCRGKIIVMRLFLRVSPRHKLFLYRNLCAECWQHGGFQSGIWIAIIRTQSERICGRRSRVGGLAGKCSCNEGKYACTCCRTETAVNLFGVVNFQLIGRKLTISVIQCSAVQTDLLWSLDWITTTVDNYWLNKHQRY